MSKKERSKQTKKPDATKALNNPRTRQELWDADYLNTLSKKDYDWYMKFMSESVNASITLNKDPMIEEYAEVNKVAYRTAKKEMKGGGYSPIPSEGKPKRGHLHTKKSHAKEIFDANNNRNNDLLGVTRINGLLEGDIYGKSLKADIWIESNPNATEEALNWAIDYKNNPDMAKRRYKKKS